MSLAFSLPIGGSSRVRALVLLSHACAALGLLAAALGLASSGELGVSGLLLAGLGLVLLSLRWALGRSGPGGCLCVDEAGASRWSWRREGGDADEPIEPLRWLVVAGVVWLEAARPGGARLSLLSGADRVGDRDWRRLLCWLRWLDRGG